VQTKSVADGFAVGIDLIAMTLDLGAYRAAMAGTPI
jgi:hypothetical protein